jgi:hypothetical protein
MITLNVQSSNGVGCDFLDSSGSEYNWWARANAGSVSVGNFLTQWKHYLRKKKIWSLESFRSIGCKIDMLLTVFLIPKNNWERWFHMKKQELLDQWSVYSDNWIFWRIPWKTSARKSKCIQASHDFEIFSLIYWNIRVLLVLLSLLLDIRNYIVVLIHSQCVTKLMK